MTPMNIVFTMAGKYTRFQAFGHKVPKYLLPLAHGTVLMQVIQSLTSARPNSKIYLIANRADQLFVPVVISILNSFENIESQLIFIEDTAGQVETAANVLNVGSPPGANEPVCFANIDTILNNRTGFFKYLTNLTGQPIGLLDTFHGSSAEYSYCVRDTEGKVEHLADRLVISGEACSGLYGFGSLSIFSQTAADILDEHRGSSFTDLYNLMISRGLDVYSHLAALKSDTIVLGTPEEYVKNIHRF